MTVKELIEELERVKGAVSDSTQVIVPVGIDWEASESVTVTVASTDGASFRLGPAKFKGGKSVTVIAIMPY